MEGTNALLANLVQTKSIERVLAPIANQVAQLILLDESFQNGEVPSAWGHLQDTAQTVNNSALKLTQLAARMTGDSEDQDLLVQMPAACDLLKMAGQAFIAAARSADDNNFSPHTRRQLVRSAKDVFEGTLKVLLVMDDAEVRKLVTCGRWVLHHVSAISGVTDMKDLVQKFQALTEAVLLLTNLSRRRQQELCNPHQRERLYQALTSLRKWLPMLSTAANTHIKYPGNPQSKSSQEYAVGQVISCVHDVMEAVEKRHMMRHIDESLEEAESQGHFKDMLEKLQSLLSGSAQSMDINELECGMEYAVRHSMTVASLASDPHRNLLSRNCQRALQQKTLLVNYYKSTHPDSNWAHDINDDYEDSCMCLMAELRDLERHVNAAVLELVVVSLKETTEPIERLLQAALNINMDSPGHAHSTADGDLEVVIDEFHAHSDRMCQVVDLLASGTTQGKEVREMHGCLQQLERLDPELVPSTLACRQAPDDQAARRHLRMLKVEWCRSLQLMLAAVDDVVDKTAFIRIAHVEFVADLEELKCSFEDHTDTILMMTRPMISGALRVSHVASAVVGSSADIKLRNKASIYINQIIKVVAAVKSAARELPQHKTEKLPALSKRCDVLQRCISKLRKLLVPSDGDGDDMNDPNLLANMDKESDVLDDDDLDDSPPAVPMQTAPPLTRGAAKPAGNQQADPQALIDHVIDLVHPRLKELSNQFVTSAIGGRQREVDLLGNHILSECNHVTELANQMVDSSCEQKQKLASLCSDVLRLTPHMLDKACHVVDLDTYQMEPLYQTADQWASALSSLEELIDQVLGEWKKLADKVVDTAKLSNHRLLSVEVRYLEDHVKAVHEYVSVASQTVDAADVVAMETCHLIKDAADDLDNVMALLGTLADLTANSGSDEDRAHLTKVGREWATRVCCITTSLRFMCRDATEKLRGPSLLPDLTSHSEVRKFVRRTTEENLSWKELFGGALLDPSSDGQLHRASCLLNQMDVVTSRMDECSTLLSLAPSPGVDWYYVPCRMLLLYWQWAQAEAQLRQVTELMLMQYYGPTQPLADRKTGSPVKLAAADGLMTTVQESKAKTQHLVHAHASADIMSRVMTHFADLEAASLKLQEHLRRGGSSSSASLDDGMTWCRRQWAFSAWNLERELRTASLSSKDVEALLSNLRSCPSAKNSTFNESSASPSVPAPAAVADALPRHRLRGTPVASSPRMAHRRPEPPTPKSGVTPRSIQKRKPNLSTLMAEAEKWELKNNAIVAVAQELARQLAAMAEIAQFGDDDAKKESKEELIYAAKAITKNGEKLVQFAKILAKYCRDKRSVKDLLYYVDHVPSLAIQLNILASVKAATPDDRTAEKMLLHNTEGLMEAINRMLRAAEVASVKGFLEPPSESHDETEAIVLATEWRQKMDIHRELELSSSVRDSLGLRKVDASSASPSLGRIQTKLQV